MSSSPRLPPRRGFPFHARRVATALAGNRWVQIGVLLVFWLVGEQAVRILSLPFPGSIVGLALLLVLLMGGWLKLPRIQRGAESLLSDMLLFFVPAALAVLEHKEFLSLTGLKILAVIVLSTATVMVVTALAVDLCYRVSHHDQDHSVVE